MCICLYLSACADVLVFHQTFCRDAARSPMQWTSDAYSGFSVNNSQPWLPVNDNYTTVNVEVQ